MIISTNSNKRDNSLSEFLALIIIIFGFYVLQLSSHYFLVKYAPVGCWLIPRKDCLPYEISLEKY